MNRPSKTKSLLIPLFTALTGIFAACTNSDYDFNEIDLTLGLGGDELVIPTSNTKEMFIDDFLELEEGDCVQVQDNGDYAFVQEGNKVDPASPKVDDTQFELGLNESFGIDLNEYWQAAKDQFTTPSSAKTRAENSSISVEIKPEKQRILKFAYDANKPEAIEALMSVDITTKLTLTATLTQHLGRFIKTFDLLEWELPEYMIIDQAKTKASAKNIEKITITQGKDGNPSKLTLENVLLENSNINLDIYLSQIDFTKRYGQGGLEGTDKLTFDDDIYLTIRKTVDISMEDIDYLSDWALNSKLGSDDIIINKATGRFNPQIDLSDLGDVNVTSVPDFLKNDGVYIDLDNPQIFLEIDNNMDVAAEEITATLSSVKDGVEIEPITIDGIRIEAFSPTYQLNHPKDEHRTTKICICLDKSKVDPDSVAIYQIHEVPNITEILKDGAIPDKIKFGLTVDVDDNRTSSVELGKEYTIQPRYKVLIPIAFGEEAKISYTDSIDNLQDDLDGIELTKGAYLEVTADVYNKLPVLLDAKVTPMTKDGKNLKESENVTVDVDEYIPGAEEGQTAKGYLKIKIGGDIKQLDKLKFTVGGQASDDKSGKSITGITLNQNKHSLRLDNVQVKLVGRIIYDAN